MRSESPVGPAVTGGRQVVLDAALLNFNDRGYHGTSMRDIARDADMKVASIYHHFGSKQQILQEIMRRVLQDSLAVTRRAILRAQGGPEAQLRELVRAWVVFHATRRHDALVGASELRSLDPLGRELVVALRAEQKGLFAEVVARGVDEGVFTVAFPDEAVRGIAGMGQSVCTWWHPGGPLDADELAERYVELALKLVR